MVGGVPPGQGRCRNPYPLGEGYDGMAIDKSPVVSASRQIMRLSGPSIRVTLGRLSSNAIERTRPLASVWRSNSGAWD